MSTEFRTSEQINELAAALAKAQGAMEPAVKSAKNPFFNSMYADLGAVMDVIQKPFADNGLAIVQGSFSDLDTQQRWIHRVRCVNKQCAWQSHGFAEQEPARQLGDLHTEKTGHPVTPTSVMEGCRIVVRTRLIHASGQFIESALVAEAKDMGPQAIGSVVTYLRRYGISAMAGVSTEDDDGESATDHAQPAREATPARPPAQNWKKPSPSGATTVAKYPATPSGGSTVAQSPSSLLVCEHGVSAPNRCLECTAHQSS